MKNRNKRNCAVEIIGGADGPTSVFVAGKHKNIWRRIQESVRRTRYRRKRARVVKNLIVNPHSLEEVRTYIMEKYQAEEVGRDHYSYKEQYGNLKSAMVQKHQPELLGRPLEEYRPKDFSDKEAVNIFLEKSREYEEKAKSISEELFPFDYHLYSIRIEDYGELHVEMDLAHDFIGVGFTGKKKYLEPILKDIYVYYGVTEKDIEEHSLRAEHLITVLAS